MTTNATQPAGAERRPICPNCGLEAPAGATLCAGCGVGMPRPSRQIRCRRCGRRASSQLVICPSCGRALQPAPSRLLTWGVPLLLALLLAVLLFDRLGVRIQVGTGNVAQVELGEMIELALLPTEMPTAEPAPLPTETLIPDPTATFAAEPTPEPVLEPTETPVPEATEPPTPEATATPLSDPTETPTATLSPTPVSAPAVTYALQAGDTLSAVAQRFGVTVENLLRANNLTAQESTRLQIGTVLTIPEPGQTFPSPTPVPPTATLPPAPPAPPAATPTITPTATPVVRLAAPVLLSPEKGTPIDCRTQQEFLVWQPVGGMAPGDAYRLHLGYVDGPPDANGAPPVVWVMAQTQTATSVRLAGESLCQMSSNQYGREWRWYVEVVSGETPVSPPSPHHHFFWKF